MDSFSLAEDNPVRGIDFACNFTNEDLSEKGLNNSTNSTNCHPLCIHIFVYSVSDIKNSPKDVELFYSTMTKMTLALVGEPPRPTLTSARPKSQTLPANSSVRAEHREPPKPKVASNTMSWQPGTWEVDQPKAIS